VTQKYFNFDHIFCNISEMGHFDIGPYSEQKKYGISKSVKNDPNHSKTSGVGF